MTLTSEMERVLAIARRDGGYVVAGKGEHAGRVERVAASTIRALIDRGFLVHCYSNEGGYAGRLPDDDPDAHDSSKCPSANPGPCPGCR